MSGVRPMVKNPGGFEDIVYPGNTLLLGESVVIEPTVGTVTLSAAEIVSGLVRRTGSTANYTDVFDTANNIVAALQGNSYAPEVVPGSSWRLRILNTVAFTNTPTFGAGIKVGTGVTAIAASQWREYLLTVVAVQQPLIVQATFTTASTSILFVLPPGRTSFVEGPNGAYNFVVGATVSGTNITAGTTIAGVTQGVGGVIGLQLSAVPSGNSAATGDTLTFGSTIQIDGIGSGTL